MKESAKKLAKKIAGIILILYGLFALVTPFTPGSWLAFVGLELLGIELLFVEKIKYKIKHRKKSFG